MKERPKFLHQSAIILGFKSHARRSSLICKMQFQPGDKILSSKPFAFVISAEYRGSICETCFQKFHDTPLACPGCNMVMYCSTKCKSHDSLHLKFEECQYLQRMECLRFFIHDQVRMILRVWLKLKALGVDNCWEGYLGSTKRRYLKDLMDHADDISNDSSNLILEYLTELSMILPSHERPSWTDIVSLYGKILVNSFSLKSDRFDTPDTFGSGLYLAASIFDHSCTPNATAFFRGTGLEIIATTSIPDLGSVRLSYVNLLGDTKSRNTELKAIWYFECTCARCNDGQEDDLKHSLSCSKCQEPRRLEATAMHLKDSKCCCCGTMNQVEDERLRMYKFLANKVNENSLTDSELEKYFQQMQGLFHPRDSTFMTVCLKLHQRCHSFKQWKRSFHFGSMILDSVRAYLGDFNESIALLHHFLGEAALNTLDLKAAELHLEEADRFYTLVPGSDHPFYKETFKPLLIDLKMKQVESNS